MAVLKYKYGGTWYDLTVGMDQGASDARYIKKAGDQVAGRLFAVGSVGTAGYHLDSIPSKAGLAEYGGGAAIIDANGTAFQPLFVADPSHANQAASKNYVDNRVIPCGYVHWGSSTRAIGWARMLEAADQVQAGGMTYSDNAMWTPSTGRYLVTYTMKYTLIGTAGGVAVGPVDSQFEEAQNYVETTGRAHTFNGASLMNLNAGQSITLWTYVGGGANVEWAWLYLAKVGT